VVDRFDLDPKPPSGHRALSRAEPCHAVRQTSSRSRNSPKI
jgi:hypothetical protein